MNRPSSRRRRWPFIALAVLIIFAGLVAWTAYRFRPSASHPAADTSWTSGGQKMRATVALVDLHQRPLPGVQVNLLTSYGESSGTTNESGFIEFPYHSGEMIALALNNVRVVDRSPTGPLGELIGPNLGWGLTIRVVVKDSAALGIRGDDEP